MTDKPKLTLSNPKIKANTNSTPSQNMEGVSLTEIGKIQVVLTLLHLIKIQRTAP